MDTFITLTILLIAIVKLNIFLFQHLIEKDKDSYSTLNLPLDNKGKWWYN